MNKKPNCIGVVRKKDGWLYYYFCKIQFWKYSPMRLSGAEDGALSYKAYDERYE